MPEKRRKCGTSEVNKRLVEQIPEYALNRRSTEMHALSWNKNQIHDKSSASGCNYTCCCSCCI